MVFKYFCIVDYDRNEVEYIVDVKLQPCDDFDPLNLCVHVFIASLIENLIEA